MHYVYILVSLSESTRYYIGRTENLETRLQQHNHGESGYSKQYAPWRLETYTAFRDPQLAESFERQLAESFERYLKSGSGFAFLKKRLLPKL
ncbi:MAG: GIY-YIG nuclease family protein [Candidatus Omnitrophica bacterium]|nr:GIY-YIG nuclease family protein [Candidatus Omnitrophota bacterium]